MEDQKTVVAYLIENVNDINAFSPSTGATALHNAVIKNQTEIVSLLIKNGANLYIQHKDKKTLLDYALSSGNHDILEKLGVLNANFLSK